jgi:hypothetical protein
MKLRVLVIVGLSLLSPSTSWAEPGAQRAGRSARTARTGRPTPPATSLHLQVARAMFPREHWKKLVDDASAALTQRLILTAEGEYELAPEFADRLREEYERMVPYEELVNVQAKLLAHEYSPAELRELLRFFRSPLGKKSIPVFHDLSATSNLQMQARVHDGMEAALGRLVTLVHPVGGGEASVESATPDAGTGDGGSAHDGAAEVPDFSATEAEGKLL